MARPVDLDRREALLAATAAHLRESGDADASLDEIAASAGTTRRMLVHYFGTKDALVAEALGRCADEGRALVASFADLFADADLADAVSTFWAWLAAENGHVRDATTCAPSPTVSLCVLGGPRRPRRFDPPKRPDPHSPASARPISTFWMSLVPS